MIDYVSFSEQLKRAKRVLIVSHYSPDGDAIGSTIALGLAIERRGKEVVLYNRDGVPTQVAHLPECGRIEQSLDPKSSFDMTIMVDCAQPKRVSDEFDALAGKGVLAIIDHHILEQTPAEVTLIDDGAASTGEVVLRFMDHEGMELDTPIAECIYTTLVVDTGFFRYSNTNERVLALASRLVAAGASPWATARQMEESYTPARMKLLGLALESIAFEYDGQYSHMTVTQQMLTQAGAKMDETDEFATYPRAVAGVEVSALFREMDDGGVKVSLRSKDRVDVAMIAKQFEGGGHARAAGCRMKGTVAQMQQAIRTAVEKALTGKSKIQSSNVETHSKSK